MKKVLLLTLLILYAGGLALAQWWPPDSPDGINPPGLPIAASPAAASAFDLWQCGVGSLSFSFNAIPVLSAARLYSAGLFSGDIDDYMDVNFFNPEIGNFVFVGGYPGDEDESYALSLGYAKSIKGFYLGFYYGGSLFESQSFSDYETPQTGEITTQWSNRLAFLVGYPVFGSFRLDFILGTDTRTGSYDRIIAKRRINAPSFTVTWGAPRLGAFYPYVSFGYKFPEKYVYGMMPEPYESATLTFGSLFGLDAGFSMDVGTNSILSAEINIRKLFEGSLKGDKYALPAGFFGAYSPVGIRDTIDLATGGAWGIGLAASFQTTFDFGPVSVGLKPGLALGRSVDKSINVSGDEGVNQIDSAELFELLIHFNLGVWYRINPKINLYTGACLQVLNWKVADHTAKYPDMPYAYKWEDSSVSGVKWSDYEPQNVRDSNSLGFGMMISPVENFSIGFGLNALLDKIFLVNVERMRVEKGSFWIDDPDMYFDFTLSYKF